MEGGHGLGPVAFKGLAAAQDRLAVGVAWAGPAQQLLEGHLLGLVFALGQLFEHHLALHGEILAIEPGRQHQVEQQVDRLGRGAGGHEHVIVHVIEAGGGIAAAAQGLNPQVEFAGPEALAALEHHVLEEMGQARFGWRFGGAAGAAPEVHTGHGGLGQVQAHHRGPLAQAPLLGVPQAAAASCLGEWPSQAGGGPVRLQVRSPP